MMFGGNAATGYLLDDVESDEDCMLLHFVSEFVPLLEMKASWLGLLEQLNIALRELFLIERDPGFDVEAVHTLGELQVRCERLSAMLPGYKRWHQH
jgi:hypothetical protein